MLDGQEEQFPTGPGICYSCKNKALSLDEKSLENSPQCRLTAAQRSTSRIMRTLHFSHAAVQQRHLYLEAAIAGQWQISEPHNMRD